MHVDNEPLAKVCVDWHPKLHAGLCTTYTSPLSDRPHPPATSNATGTATKTKTTAAQMPSKGYYSKNDELGRLDSSAHQHGDLPCITLWALAEQPSLMLTHTSGRLHGTMMVRVGDTLPARVDAASARLSKVPEGVRVHTLATSS